MLVWRGDVLHSGGGAVGDEPHKRIFAYVTHTEADALPEEARTFPDRTLFHTGNTRAFTDTISPAEVTGLEDSKLFDILE